MNTGTQIPEGKRKINLARDLFDALRSAPLTRDLFLTDLGYYPRADYHFCQRAKGVNEYVVLYCNNGTGWVEYEQQQYQMSINDFCILPAGQPHAYGANPKDPWSVYWIHFSGALADDWYGQYKKEDFFIINTHFERKEQRNAMFEEIYKILRMGDSWESLIYVNQVFKNYLSSFIWTHQFRGTKYAKSHDVVHQAISILKSGISDNITLEELAHKNNLSVPYFSKLFRTRTGFAPVDYYIRLKMQKACDLLSFSDMTIKQVAAHIGYNDPYYFSRIFKKTIGTSPSAYRKEQLIEQMGHPETESYHEQQNPDRTT
ncbi:AraC family transcriptional regulator [Persicobacter psychrovividus]|uniref:Transcriptional regulator n=1 Tax=Persicobacter psychrovividus TaxID=387638 RepID=A0ABM7VIV4_9BACT|nr:transcriptional regulator [Persicobacter psychrovividus]